MPESEAILIYFSSYAVLDFLMQMTICYICWTMGSDEQLKDYDCLIVISESGRPMLQLKPKNPLNMSYNTLS